MSANPGETLTVSARDVVKQKFDPGAYPYRHLAVMQTGTLGSADSQVPVVMSAVEAMSRIGWELAGFSMFHRTVVAVLRRVG